MRYSSFEITLSSDARPENVTALMNACRDQTPVEVTFQGDMKRKMLVAAVSVGEPAHVVATAPRKRRRARKARKR